MAWSRQNHQKNICYRCRESCSPSQALISCCLCSLYWHVDCLFLSKSYFSSSSSSSSRPSSPSLEDPPPGSAHWICPQHHKTEIVKKRKVNNKKYARYISRSEMIEDFEVADEMIKYGGVINDVSEKTLENEFLDYAKRYRHFNRPEKYQPAEFEAEEEWLDGLTSFQDQETNNDNIQMLIDAASIDLDILPLPPNEEEKVVNLDENEYKLFQTIQKLIDLKGEDALLELLSKTNV